MLKILHPTLKIAQIGSSKVQCIATESAPDFSKNRLLRQFGATALFGVITATCIASTAANLPVSPELINIPLLHVPDAQNLPDLLQGIAISLGKQTFFGMSAIAAAGIYPRTFAALGRHAFGARSGTSEPTLDNGPQGELVDSMRNRRVTSLFKGWLGANALGPFIPAAKHIAERRDASVRHMARMVAGSVATIAATDVATHTWQLVANKVPDRIIAPEVHALSTALTSPFLFGVLYLLSQHGDKARRIAKAAPEAVRGLGSAALRYCSAWFGLVDPVPPQEQILQADKQPYLAQFIAEGNADGGQGPLAVPPSLWAGDEGIA